MIVMIDNYDSFTWNLVQMIESITGETLQVVRNDAFEPATLIESKPRAIVVSPGPGTPSHAGRIVDLVRADHDVPLLGVCLGHQAIGEAFGARVVRASVPVHGKVWDVEHRGTGLFAGAPAPLRAARYHSLVLDPASIPAELAVDAETPEGEVMAITHRSRPLFGVQFHPESYGTTAGDVVIRNFFEAARGER